jgi:predicted RNA binding protein YcfA (HicA-like mRNA interferase family)
VPSNREIIKQLHAAGWIHDRTKGDHWIFKHEQNPALITVVHPRKDNPAGYVRALEKISGVKLR